MERLIIIPGAGGERGRKRILGALYLAKELENALICFVGYDVEKDKELKKYINAAKKYAKRFNSDFIVLSKSRTTVENALEVKPLIEKLNTREAYIVTDEIHYGRTKSIFDYELEVELNYVIVKYLKNVKDLIKNVIYEVIAYPISLTEKYLIPGRDNYLVPERRNPMVRLLRK